MSAGQSQFPLDTMEAVLRDIERRILQMERRPTYRPAVLLARIEALEAEVAELRSRLPPP